MDLLDLEKMNFCTEKFSLSLKKLVRSSFKNFHSVFSKIVELLEFQAPGFNLRYVVYNSSVEFFHFSRS